MEANVSAREGQTTIRLNGRFDFSAHRVFRDAVAQALVPGQVRELRVDLGDVGYLDSSALGMLLMLRDKARAADCALALANCTGNVKQILDIANFGRLFSMV